MYRYLLTLFLVFGATGLFANNNETDHAVHTELRALLTGIEAAVNQGKYDRLKHFFHKDLSVTMSNQETLSSYEDIERYFDFWFGTDGFLEKVEMKLVADATTKLYADKRFGIVHGSGEENVYLSDSRFYPMKTRWTATVSKTADGQWRILSLHIGVDFLNNPVLDVVEDSVKYVGLASAAAGLLFGLFFGFLVWRRRAE